MAGGLALVLAAAALVAAALALHRAGTRERARRRDLLADCAALLEGPSIETDAAGYGVLKGRYLGREVALRPFVDTLVFRRLPQLWLAATVRDAAEPGPTLEIMRRSTGAEFYAAPERLPARFGPPRDWPPDAESRGTADAAGLLADLARPLGRRMTDPRLKSVYVSPRGVRAIRQVAEGARGAYLLFRDVAFAAVRIAPADAEAALHDAIAAADARRFMRVRNDAPDQAAG